MATKKSKDAAPSSQETKAKGPPRQVKNIVPIASQNIPVYASPKVSKAFQEVTEDMTLYHGVRLSEVLEAVYNQGQKDGARNAIKKIQENLSETIGEIPHRNPGKPKKK
ncbi:hypothetical protein ACQ859_27885 [Roseateles chitinivorans]|uniref:hypothetical protein n=1 Tax=Roseateles chitinivorans TaxID=2917965 RepID=UPI003D672EBC